MPNKPPPIRRLLFINEDEDNYALFKAALEAVDPAIEPYYLSGCDYSHFGEGSYVPDLIFLDMGLSVLDGYGCLKKIREGGYAAVPVIVYGTNDHYRDIEEAYRYGANLYVVRPGTLALLLSCLEKLLKETNWQDPGQVTRAHLVEGAYLAFEVK